MHAILDQLSEETEFCTQESIASPPASQTLDELEQRYRRAHVRLLDAQEKKMEATAEFLAARTALRHTLEAIWPDPNEYADAPRPPI